MCCWCCFCCFCCYYCCFCCFCCCCWHDDVVVVKSRWWILSIRVYTRAIPFLFAFFWNPRTLVPTVWIYRPSWIFLAIVWIFLNEWQNYSSRSCLDWKTRHNGPASITLTDASPKHVSESLDKENLWTSTTRYLYINTRWGILGHFNISYS